MIADVAADLPLTRPLEGDTGHLASERPLTQENRAVYQRLYSGDHLVTTARRLVSILAR